MPRCGHLNMNRLQILSIGAIYKHRVKIMLLAEFAR